MHCGKSVSPSSSTTGVANNLSVFYIDEGSSGLTFGVNFPQSRFVQWSMQLVEQLDPVTIQRLRKQSEFLLTIYRAELSKDPSSRATKASRSNLIAVQHSVRQMYGEAVARELANLVAPLQYQ